MIAKKELATLGIVNAQKTANPCQKVVTDHSIVLHFSAVLEDTSPERYLCESISALPSQVKRIVIFMPKRHTMHSRRLYLLDISWQFIEVLLGYDKLKSAPASELGNCLDIQWTTRSVAISIAREKTAHVNMFICKNFCPADRPAFMSSLSIVRLEAPICPKVRVYAAGELIAREMALIQSSGEGNSTNAFDEKLVLWKNLAASRKGPTAGLGYDIPHVNTLHRIDEVQYSASESDSQPSTQRTGRHLARLEVPRLKLPVDSMPSNAQSALACKYPPASATMAFAHYEPLITCILPSRLYVGGERPCSDEAYLRATGITTVINLSPETCTYEQFDGITYHYFNVKDSSAFDITYFFQAVFDIIDSSVEETSKSKAHAADKGYSTRYKLAAKKSSRKYRSRSATYLHCQKGVSRSITIAAAYCIWKYGVSAADCLRSIKGESRFLCASLCGQLLDPTDEELAKSIEIQRCGVKVSDPDAPERIYEISYIRPIAQPNAGFTLQLYNYAKPCTLGEVSQSR